MSDSVITPGQVRAARALLEFSQEQLAKLAGVGINSVRDIESQRRPAEAGTLKSISRALNSAGVRFVPGDDQGGPGVRLVADRPSIIRRPTVMSMWDGMPVDIEFRGRKLTGFLRRDDLDDMGRVPGGAKMTDADYVAIVEKNLGDILDALAKAAADPSAYNERDRSGTQFYVRSSDYREGLL